MSLTKRFHEHLLEKIDNLTAQAGAAKREIAAEKKAINERADADKRSYERIDLMNERWHDAKRKLVEAKQELREVTTGPPAHSALPPLHYPEEE